MFNLLLLILFQLHPVLEDILQVVVTAIVTAVVTTLVFIPLLPEEDTLLLPLPFIPQLSLLTFGTIRCSSKSISVNITITSSSGVFHLVIRLLQFDPYFPCINLL